jgi:hypothetical protein
MASDVTIASSDSSEAQAAAPDSGPGGIAARTGEWEVWRVGMAIAIPTAVIGAFVCATWWVERFREGVGVLAPYLPLTLYGAVVALLVASAVHRLLRARLGTRERSRSPLLHTLAGLFAFCGAVLVYLVALADRWENSRGQYSAIAGVVPWSDADNYFIGAERLLFSGYLDDWSSRRPLNGAFLADRLAVTNLDLRLAVVIQAILLGAACYIAARTVAQDLGPIAGLALFAGMYSFASFSVETTMSESLGLTLGALAFAALWNAVRDRSVWLSAAGLLLLALALTARPGTVVILLVLPIFFALYLRGGKRLGVRVLGVGAAAIAVAFGLNVLTAAILDGTPSNLNGSFYPTLYGLAKGNEVWRQVYSDYPQTREMSEPQANKFIRARAIEEIRRHPATFIKGLARSTRDHLSYARDTIMAPVALDPLVLYAGAALGGALAVGVRWRRSRWRVLLDLALFGGVVLAVPVLFGLWVPERTIEEWLPLVFVAFGYLAFVVVGTDRIRSSAWTFAVVCFAGIAASLGLTTIRDIGPRVYAATAPFFALAFAGAVAVFARILVAPRDSGRPAPTRSRAWSWLPVALGGGIVVVAIVAAPFAMATVSEPKVRARTCPDGRRAVALTGGVAVHLVSNQPRAEDELDELDLAHFSPEVVEVATSIRDLPPGTTLMQALPLNARYVTLTVVEGFVEPPGRSVLYLCGQTRLDPYSQLPIFFGKPLRS